MDVPFKKTVAPRNVSPLAISFTTPLIVYFVCAKRKTGHNMITINRAWAFPDLKRFNCFVFVIVTGNFRLVFHSTGAKFRLASIGVKMK